MADKKRPRPPIVPPDPDPIREIGRGATFHGIGPWRFLLVLMVTPEIPKRVVVRGTITKVAKASFRASPSTWIILTNESPQDWYDRLHPFFDRDDRLFIVPIEIGEYAAKYPALRKWLRAYFGRSEDFE